MRARWAAWALVCACAAAAPAADLPTPRDSSSEPTAICDNFILKNPPLIPSNARDYEATAVLSALSLSKYIVQNKADEAHTTELARNVARTKLNPPIDAVALGAPQLHLGVLYLAASSRMIIFQHNNSATLPQFWRTLASGWNETTAVWSNAWFSCDKDGRGWWAGVSAAQGAGPLRAAAAIFRRIESLPCESSMYEYFGGPPLCDPLTTECEAFPTNGFGDQRLQYRCKCRVGYYHPDGDGWSTSENLSEYGELSCVSCTINNAAMCLGEVYRVALFAANLAGMLICVVTGLVIFKKRKCKAVAMGMWTVLEVILLGALLMYASAASQYISVARWRCILGAWFRELGFVACYGSVVLRLWVLLAEFRTRKAHRWTPRDSEVLRIVGAMVSGAACYLAAFTATTACEGDADTEEGCARSAWHHVTAAAELLLLVAGARIAYAARNANVPFQERGLLATALCCEGVCGGAWRAAALMGVAPERSPLAATARAHLSSGVAVACAIAPRLWHGYRARSLAQEVSRRGPAEGFGVEGEEEPTSEEVRAELKRLYVQLEILRNKTLRRDNPHISKRRGGRKPPHRRFSLQALQARRGGKGKAGGSTSAVEPSEVGDASRTPEDSVCSVEGPSHYTDGDVQA